jgi:hypothetical protein
MLFILLINLNYYEVINNKFNYFLGFYIHGAIEIEDLKSGNTQKVNGQRLKPFLELEIPEIEELPLEDPTPSN